MLIWRWNNLIHKFFYTFLVCLYYKLFSKEIVKPLLNNGSYGMEFTNICRWICKFGQNFLLKKEIGWMSWIRTAPMPVPDASVYIINCFLKSGKDKTGALVIDNFSVLKASWAFSFNWKSLLLKGQWGQKRLRHSYEWIGGKKPVKPKKLLTVSK